MGIVKYGPLADEVSGTVGGVTFARVHSAKSVRAWRAPVNKRRTAQLTQRYLFARSSGRWFDSLDSTQRGDWDDYAATCSFTNALSEEYFLKGFNMYVRNNSIVVAQGFSDFTEAPTAEGFPPTITLTLTLIHATGVLTLTDQDPAPSNPSEFLFECHTIRKQSRQFPVRQLYSRAYVDFSHSPPYVLCTYPNPLPGSAGQYHALVIWYYWDANNRISKPYTQLVISE
jgi:hypothetical protein